MADAETTIANRALQTIGAARILSMGDDTKQGRACAACYVPLRDAELRKHAWKFATVRAAIPALAELPAWGFASQFPLPSDCLRLVQVGEFPDDPSLSDYRAGPEPLYALEGGVILTDLPAPLSIRYVRRAADAAHFDPLFAEALAARMAIAMAVELTDSTTKTQIAQGLYAEAIRAAIRTDAIERASEAAGDGAWVSARR